MTDRSHRHRRFSRRLLGAVGLGALTGLALAGGACGGHVVLDSTSTGAGGTSSAGSNVGGTGMGGAGASVTVGEGASSGVGPYEGVTVGAGGDLPGCSAAVSPPEELITACFVLQTGACPEAAQAQAQLAQLLGDCDLSVNACCGMPTLEQVVCGPSVNSGQCCYNGVFASSYACAPAP